MNKIRDALAVAQAWVIETGGWLYMGWHLSADFLAYHKYWNLVGVVALIVLGVVF